MGRRRNDFFNLEITDLSSEGKGVARHEERVIFVDDAIPGDTVDGRVYKKKKSFAYARPVKFHTYSSKRVAPFCNHYDNCGGCKLQHITYQHQLEYKHKQVVDAFQRIGHLAFPEVKPVLASEQTQYYRNKLEFTFSNMRWLTGEEINSPASYDHRNALGFHIAGHYDKVLDIGHCYLQAEPSNAIRLAARQYALDNGLSFYDIKEQKGLLRNLVVRTSSLDEVMVIAIFGEDMPKEREGLLNSLKEQFPAVNSWQYVINPGKNDAFLQYDVHLFSGTPYIEEQLGALRFRIGPKSFFQTNSLQAKKLYNIAKTMAQLTEQDVVYDLYTGTGSIAQYIAGSCKQVIGIEEVKAAIEDAKQNAVLNGITNCRFIAGDVKEILKNEGGELPRPDVIITDPPRAGMHKDVVEQIRQSGAKRIVYVSCNPATQARDLQLLGDKYDIQEVQPVDMFPHTPHVENVTLLQLKG